MQDAHPANTFDAHRLLHFAAAHGLQAELTERLMKAYFEQGLRVGVHGQLVGWAAEVGLDPDAARAVLAGTTYSDDVAADIALAAEFGRCRCAVLRHRSAARDLRCAGDRGLCQGVGDCLAANPRTVDSGDVFIGDAGETLPR